MISLPKIQINLTPTENGMPFWVAVSLQNMDGRQLSS